MSSESKRNMSTGYAAMTQDELETLKKAQAILDRLCYFSIAQLVGEVIEEEW